MYIYMCVCECVEGEKGREWETEDKYIVYCKISNITHTKSQNLNDFLSSAFIFAQSIEAMC